jgi:hypothetical protein
VIAECRREDDAVNVGSKECLNRRLLLLNVFVSIADNHLVGGLAAGVLNGSNNLREERIIDIGHHHTKCFGVTTAKGACD